VVLADSNTEVAVSPTGDTARTGARLGPDPEVAVSPTGDTARTGARLGPARTGSDLKVPAVSPAVSPAGDTAVDA
jgi:hypothetical protein